MRIDYLVEDEWEDMKEAVLTGAPDEKGITFTYCGLFGTGRSILDIRRIWLGG